ncbi:MAG: branched-chain amino acid ABC transporter permease [Paracoccaceae bacterium]|nr:branched-chain amino acid ABC transporter permease [Paracoccaceae bacterium]
MNARNLFILVLLGGLVLAPFVLREYHVEIFILFFINVILISSYRVTAMTGDWTLSHVIFMGIGAYATALFTKLLGWPIWLTMPLSGVAAAVIGLAVVYPLLRTKGFGFFIASFAIGEFIRLIWIKFNNPFGGARGMIGIPTIEIGSIDFYEAKNFYFFTLFVMLACLVVIYRIDRSRIGQALRTIYADDDLAESIGINVRYFRMKAFMIASFFAGIAGALMAHRLQAIDPHNFNIETMVYLVIWIVVGGSVTFWGPLMGVGVMTIIFELSRPLHEWRPLLFGIILIVVLTMFPGGMEALLETVKSKLAEFRSKRRAS